MRRKLNIFMKIYFLATLIFCSALLAGCGSDDESIIPTPDGTVFFLVSEMTAEKGDSYILPLTDPAHIATARAIVADRDSEELEKLVVAKVVRSKGNEEHLNKDLLRNVTWSWKISEFEGFYGSTIEILDGGPQDLQNDMDWWIDNTSDDPDYGVIGFWNYTVVREVTPEEIAR